MNHGFGLLFIKGKDADWTDADCEVRLRLNLEELRALVCANSIVVTNHCMKRMVERGIELSEAKRAIMEGEIIEEYPEDYPYPSCLILGRGLHIVAGQGDGVLWLITAYRPDLGQWENDLKTRRKTT